MRGSGNEKTVCIEIVQHTQADHFDALVHILCLSSSDLFMNEGDEGDEDDEDDEDEDVNEIPLYSIRSARFVR